MASIDEFFRTVKLPTLSHVAQELVRSLNDEDAGAREVAGIIARDPALSAKLLRLANSAQFGLPRSVGSVDEAVALVGMSRTRTLCLGAALSESFPALPGLDAATFWRGSCACAGYAQWLAGPLRMDVGQAWLTGMMLRLGELLVGQADPQALAEIEKLPVLPGVRWQRESHRVGHTEGQITAELARRWKFPLEIVTGLAGSADPLAMKPFSRLAAIVHLAGLLADVPEAQAAVIDELPQDVIAALQLEADWLKARLPNPNGFIVIG